MLPSFVIVKILTYNTLEIPKYRRIFTQNRVRRELQHVLNTELFKAQYLVHHYPKYAYTCLHSDNIEIVKLGIEHGATCFDWCLDSNNLEVVKLGIAHGADDFNSCLWNTNLEIVKLGIEHGANEFYVCGYSNNLEIILIGLKHIDLQKLNIS